MFKDLLCTLELNIKQKYSNTELYLYQYFLNKTGIKAKYVIIIDEFVFYFIEINDYLKAKTFLKDFRRELKNRKILLIKNEKTIMKLLFSFFPDIYIHDIELDFDEKGETVMKIYFLSYEERKIAVGRSGDYIKAVNKLFDKYIIPVKIKCELWNLDYQVS